jgi:hypothetical protein
VFSTSFDAGAGRVVSTMKASPAITALGASGNSFAAQTPLSTNTANAEDMIDFMSAAP